jgi:hypothetical protein
LFGATGVFIERLNLTIWSGLDLMIYLTSGEFAASLLLIVRGGDCTALSGGHKLGDWEDKSNELVTRFSVQGFWVGELSGRIG